MTLYKHFPFFSLAILTLLFNVGHLLAADTVYLTQAEVDALFKSTSRSNVSVHDPSVVHTAGNTYYIIGSHRGWAFSSDNMINWQGLSNRNLFGKLNSSGKAVACDYADAFSTNETRTVRVLIDGTPQEVTFGNFDAKAWAHGDQTGWNITGNMWAPDLLWNPSMGKWCMYMSLNGDYWHSVIVLLTADKITGPYVYQGPVHYSGFLNESIPEISWKKTDLELVVGKQSSLPAIYAKPRTGSGNWGEYWTNDIDPCIFFDEEGELWMAYGSWSGGIFLLKLDKQTGLRDYTYTYPTENDDEGRALSDPYFGRRIAGGYYSSGEGPYIKHFGHYYYLFISYGGFAPDGGYEMRTFRASKPEGPYLDAAGLDACYHNRYWLNFGPNAQTNGGMKLLGAYNGWGLQTVGECAQGHNSAIQDEQGRNFVIYHTKFNNGTDGHQVRTRQLFLNQNGWLCSAPFQFDGETVTDASIAAGCPFTPNQIAGAYQVLIHKYKMDHQNFEEVKPINIRLTADGRITGNKTGTWSLVEGTSYINLVLGGVTYRGVVVPQTLDGTDIPAVGITATAETGNSCGVQLWGYHLEPCYPVAYTARENKPELADGQVIRNNVTLPAEPYLGATIKWTSSHPDILSTRGRYVAPESTTEVTLTCTITCDSVAFVREYHLTVAPDDDLPDGDYRSGLVAYYSFTTKASPNQCNKDQKPLFKKLGEGTAPAIVRDSERSNYVLHQFFGGSSDVSYTLMDNPLKGASSLKGMTIALWVKMTADNNWDAIWSFANKEANDATARFFMTGNAYVGFNNGSTWFDINHPNNGSTGYLPAGKWVHLIVTVASSGVGIYVDGEKKAQKAFAGSAAYGTLLSFLRSASFMQLGTGSFWGSADCYIDDLLVYNRVLSADDIKLLNILARRADTDYTAVHDILADKSAGFSSSGDDVIYDLSGRQIGSRTSLNRQLPKGIYIIQGRKVLIK